MSLSHKYKNECLHVYTDPPLSVCGIAWLGTINTVSCHRLNNEWDIDTDQHPQAPSIPSGWREREREKKKNQRSRSKKTQERGEEPRGGNTGRAEEIENKLLD